MLRLSRVLSNKETTIIKIEGQIHEEDLNLLHDELEQIRHHSSGEIIVNLSSLSFVSPTIVRVLKAFAGRKVFLMNCEPFLRNVVQAAGLTRMVLD